MKTITKFFENLLAKILEPYIKACLKTIEGKVEDLENLTGEINARIVRINEKLTPAKIKQVVDPSLFEYPEKGLKIRIEKTNSNSKDSFIFHTTLPCWNEGRPDFFIKAPFDKKYVWYKYGQSMEKSESRVSIEGNDLLINFIDSLFKTNHVTILSTFNAFEIIVHKPGACEWEESLPKILEAIASNFPDIETGEVKKEQTAEVEG